MQIKWNLNDTESNTYIDFSKENDDKDPKFKIGNFVEMWKHKKIFAIGYVPNFDDLKDKEIVETFYKNELQKSSQKKLKK